MSCSMQPIRRVELPMVRSASATWCRMASWSSKCAARSRSSRASSASSPAFCIRRGSPLASALAMANWFTWLPASSNRRTLRSPPSAAAMKRDLRSSNCQDVASTLPSVA